MKYDCPHEESLFKAFFCDIVEPVLLMMAITGFIVYIIG